MKILPEHETLVTIMSKLIQIVCITFELPIDDLHISNSGTFCHDSVPKKTLTFLEYENDEEDVESKYDSARNSIATLLKPQMEYPSPSIQNVYDDSQCIPHDLKAIDDMIIELDVPCRVTGVLTRGIY